MKKIKRRLISIVLALCLAVCIFPANSAYAKTTSQQIKDAEKTIKTLKKDAANKQAEIDELNKKKKKLQTQLKKLNTELESITEHINDLEQQIIDKEAEIVATQLALEEAKEREANQYASMKKRIQFMYEDSSTLFLEMLFSAKSFSDLLTLNDYITSLSKYDRGKLNEYEANRENIEQLEARLEVEKIELDQLKAEAQDERKRVSEVIAATSANIEEYKDLLDDAEEDMLEYERKLENMNNDLTALKEKLAEEIRLSQLAMTSTWRDISEVEFADTDRYLLAVLIYCEAGGEPYEGKVAVGAVVMNRVLSSRYPNTIQGVIYQKYQFSPVGSGRLAKYLAIGKTNAACYRAADAAMSGYSNVGNVTHFRTPIDGLTGIQIGNHIFY